MIRNPDQVADLEEVGAEAMVVDLENKDLAEEHLAGVDAVVVAAGDVNVVPLQPRAPA